MPHSFPPRRRKFPRQLRSDIERASTRSEVALTDSTVSYEIAAVVVAGCVVAGAAAAVAVVAVNLPNVAAFVSETWKGRI